MHVNIYFGVYLHIWKPVSTNNCTGFIPVSSFSVLIMLFSGSGDSGSSIDSLVTSLGQPPSCLAASPRPRGSLLPLHSFWHSEPGCLCRDDLSSCLTHPYPQCQQTESRNTFHLAWLCHIAASPHCNVDALPSLLKCSLSIPGHLILLTWSPLPPYSPCEQAYYFQLHLELFIFCAVTSDKNTCCGKYS